ncbi:MAG: acetate--CoA ligase [Thaumarchaeota archaeon]|nr:acetate--CoA ligase [Nitrososphaerota archaeon]MCZ6724749.1 acetate--CoA ligase [Nitrososphaerota archaeon]
MSNLDWETTDRVLKEERLFRPSQDVVDNANITQYMKKKGFTNWDELYSWSIKNPEEFWADVAQELNWFKKWDKVLEWNFPYAKWFLGGRTNIVYNCLDRHMGTPIENKIAYFWEGEDGSTKRITYGELYREVNRFSLGLKELGIKKGDRVCIYMPRILEQVIAMLSVARLGAVHTLVYSGFSSRALIDRIQDAGVKLVITADGYPYRGKIVNLKKIVDDAVADCPDVKHVILAKRANIDANMTNGRDLFWDDVLRDGQLPCEDMDSEDMLYILYTSGTTGKPKGAVHVHGGYMVGIYATLKYVFDLKENDVWWCTADPGWVTGHSYIVYAPLCLGTSSIFYEGAPDFPNPGRWWSIMEKYKVSVLYSTPTSIRGLMRFGDEWPAKYDLSSLRHLGTVGEPINPEAWIWYRKVTGDKHPIMDTWWMTETGMHLITPTPVTPLKPGSATLPFLGVEADVVDKNGNSVPIDKGGYLVIRKPWPSMFRTVFKDPERYEAYWKTIEGVYFAGDAAHKDKDGYFWIQGRVDDVIKKSGYRLGSMEIESAIVSHPKAAEAAVIGKPDPLKGESIKAFVILRAGNEPSKELSDELRKHVRTTLGVIASPDEIDFVSSLPKTRSGKIMRRLLKAKELGLPIGDVSTLEE